MDGGRPPSGMKATGAPWHLGKGRAGRRGPEVLVGGVSTGKPCYDTSTGDREPATRVRQATRWHRTKSVRCGVERQTVGPGEGVGFI